MYLHVFTCFFLVFTCIYMMYLLLTLAIKNICPKSLKWFWMQYEGGIPLSEVPLLQKKTMQEDAPQCLADFLTEITEIHGVFFHVFPMVAAQPRCCQHQTRAFNVSDTLEHVAAVLETAVKTMPKSVQQVGVAWGTFQQGLAVLSIYVSLFDMIYHDST